MKLTAILGVLIVFAALMVFAVKFPPSRAWLSDFSMPLRHGVSRDRGIMVPMRDGVRLFTTVYKPLRGEGPYPVVLIRTTYGGVGMEIIKLFVRNGYVVVTQSVRARFESEGAEYSPHRYSRQDGYDTIDWIVKQDWCSGKIGTFGCSFLGETQVMLAAARHPNHVAMIALGAGGAIGKAKDSYGYFGIYENGVLNLASALGWFSTNGAKDYKVTPRAADFEERMSQALDGLPVADLARRVVPFRTGYEDIVLHDLKSDWWDSEGYISQEDSFTTACLHINSWYDQTVHDTFRLAEFMSENAANARAGYQHVMIDPGNHCSPGKLQDGVITVGEMEFQYEDPDYDMIYLQWFDHWLKGTGAALPPPFRFFHIHGGQWLDANSWPPHPGVEERLFLSNSGLLTREQPAFQHEAHSDHCRDSFRYDPMDPVPTLGGPICCTYRESDVAGAVDQSFLRGRDDVLIYASEILARDWHIMGNIKANLSVTSSAKDTDYTVKVVDEYPDGRSYNMQDGVIRLRYRNGIDNVEFITPGEVYQVVLELRPISYCLKEGHRIAVYISSSNFPRLARNLNTGENEYSGTRAVIADNSVWHCSDFLSYITIPLAP